MSITDGMTDAQARAMFGLTRDALERGYDLSQPALRNSLQSLAGPEMFVMSILSDAQELMENGGAEMARQYINRAKYALSTLLHQRVAQGTQAQDAAAQGAQGSRQTLIFNRVERGRIGAFAIVVLELDPAVGASGGAALKALRRAVTDWVSQEREGRDLWKYACEELNIGDLLSHRTDGLRPYLEKHGIRRLESLPAAGDAIVSYDTVLVEDDEPAADISAGARHRP